MLESRVETACDSLWAVVRVERGFAVEVRICADEQVALQQESAWRSKMNPDYDDVGVFEALHPVVFRRGGF